MLIALITDGPAVYKILSHIGLPTEAPAIVSARAPPQIDLVFEGLAELNHRLNRLSTKLARQKQRTSPKTNTTQYQAVEERK